MPLSLNFNGGAYTPCLPRNLPPLTFVSFQVRALILFSLGLKKNKEVFPWLKKITAERVTNAGLFHTRSGTSRCDPHLCSENWVGDAGGWVLPRPPATLSPWIHSTVLTAKENGSLWVQRGHRPTRQADRFYF